MIGIDFNYLIESLTPPVHRTIEVVSSIKANFKPLEQLKDTYEQFYSDIEYELTWNGQVCMLEHLLNEKFDSINSGIFITDAVNIDKLHIFNLAENNEITIVSNESEPTAPTYIHNKSEVSEYHFIVNIPSSVTFNEEQLKYYVNKYKLAGKRWKIEIV